MSNDVLQIRDLANCVRALPRDLADTIKTHGGIVAGGFVRSIVAGEKVNDIDVFLPAGSMQAEEYKAMCETAAQILIGKRGGGRLYKTDNAITVLCAGRVPVQFIHRWRFNALSECIASFDFTVCAAGITWTPGNVGVWQSMVESRFYADLAARRLTYCAPVLNEDAGGSMMRAVKFLRRNYSLDPKSLGALMARTINTLHVVPSESSEELVAKIITGKLREVDPFDLIPGLPDLDAVVLDETSDAEVLATKEQSNA